MENTSNSTPRASGGLVGRVVADRYRVVGVVSSGANTLIADAVDLEHDVPVTVKILRPDLAEDDDFRERFGTTASAVVSLRHPNIASLLDWGEFEADGRTSVFWVVEHLAGGSLRDLVDRGRLLTASQSLVVGLEACRALDAGHQAGQVHTEVTPAKLVFGTDRRLRIVDFGMARLLGEANWKEPARVPTHVARYASPEQALGMEPDAKTDVYALSLSLLEAVTGSLPFSADSTVATLSARVGKLLPVSADLGSLAAVLERAGRPEAEDRSTAAEFGQGLVQAAGSLPRPEPVPILSTGLFDSSELRRPTDPTGGFARPAAEAAGAAAVAAGVAVAAGDDVPPGSGDAAGVAESADNVVAATGDDAATDAGEAPGQIDQTDTSGGEEVADDVEDDGHAVGLAAAAVAGGVAAAGVAAHAAPDDLDGAVVASAGSAGPTTDGITGAAAAGETPAADDASGAGSAGETPAPDDASGAGSAGETPAADGASGAGSAGEASAEADSAASVAPPPPSEPPAPSSAAFAEHPFPGDTVERAPATTPMPAMMASEVYDPEPEVFDDERRGPKIGRILLIIVLVLAGIGALSYAGLLLFRTKSHEVPELVGETEAVAMAEIGDNDWIVVTERERNDDFPEPDTIIGTEPMAGVMLDEGAEFIMLVSDGPEFRTLGEYSGPTYEDAAAEVSALGLEPTEADKRKFSETVPDGSVISWKVVGSEGLAAGAKILPGETVEFTVSKGPRPREVPDVVNLSVEEASAAVEDLQLRFRQVDEVFSDSFEPGRIVSQSPVAGEKVERGSRVSVEVSKGPDVVFFPDVEGLKFAKAKRILERDDFKIGSVLGTTEGRVISTSVNGSSADAGEIFRRGTTVDVISL